MNAAEIIEALGGSSEVSAFTGVSLPAVSNWKVRGFSPAYHLDILRLAQAKNRSDITPEVIKAAEGRPARTHGAAA